MKLINPGGVTVTSTGGTMTLNGTGQTVDIDAEVFNLEGGFLAWQKTQ